MVKVLSILCIITIALTGSAQMTYKYITYGYGLVNEAIAVVDALLPSNVFHSKSPETQYNRGTYQPPYYINMGKFTGLIHGVDYVYADTLQYLYGRFTRFMTDYDNQTYFPYPINDYQNPYRYDDDYEILSVDWYPTIYRIRGDFGTINNSTGRSVINALKINVNYVLRDGADIVGLNLAYSETYYLIIDGYPRYLDPVTGDIVYANIYKGTDSNGAFYATKYNDLAIKIPYTLYSVRDTGMTLNEYMESL